MDSAGPVYNQVDEASLYYSHSSSAWEVADCLKHGVHQLLPLDLELLKHLTAQTFHNATSNINFLFFIHM